MSELTNEGIILYADPFENEAFLSGTVDPPNPKHQSWFSRTLYGPKLLIFGNGRQHQQDQTG